MPRLKRDLFTPKPVTMPGDYDQYATRINGPMCTSCRTNEARCAFKAGCCDACSHVFGEPELPARWAAA